MPALLPGSAGTACRPPRPVTGSSTALDVHLNLPCLCGQPPSLCTATMLALSTCLPRCFTPRGSRPSGRASGPSPASGVRPGQPATKPRAAASQLSATGGKGEPEPHVDKRSGDPEHGGLT